MRKSSLDYDNWINILWVIRDNVQMVAAFLSIFRCTPGPHGTNFINAAWKRADEQLEAVILVETNSTAGTVHCPSKLQWDEHFPED